MSRRTFTHKKRKSASASSAEIEEDVGMELQNLRTRVEQLELRETALAQHINCEGVTDMMVTGERRRLVILLYQGNYSASMVQLRERNAILVEVLRAQLANKQGSTEQSICKEQQHIDGILLDMVRAHNIHKVPVLSAAFSLLGECNHLAREYHDIVARYHRGAALSETWVREFLEEARAWRPEPIVIMIEGVAITVYDNLSMKVDYSSYSSEGATGYTLNMTNWLSMRVNRSLAPTMDARKLCASPPPCSAHMPAARPCHYPAEPTHVPVQSSTASSARTSPCGASRGYSSQTTWRSSGTRSGAGRCSCATRATRRCWTGRPSPRCGDRTRSTTRRCSTCCSRPTRTWSMSSASCGTSLRMSRFCLWQGMAWR